MGKKTFLTALAVMFLFGAAQLSAQIRFGGQLNYGDDTDFGLGPRLVLDDPALGEFRFIGSFDLYFPDSPSGVEVDYWEVNGNIVYDFEIVNSPKLKPYVGGGLNIAHASAKTTTPIPVSASNTDLGVNLMGGLEFGVGKVRPFVELKVELEGGDQFVITGGVLF
jgi:opacity protein-like surface antigen